MEKIRERTSSTIQGPGYRVYYIRYADDFLIGINGPRRIAENLKQELRKFFLDELSLTLDLEKTKITHSDQGACFLGARIKRHVSQADNPKMRAV